MISRSDDYVEYCRETAKKARDLHDLALRGRHLKEVTKLVHRQIAEEVGLGLGDDLIDVGCVMTRSCASRPQSVRTAQLAC